MKKTKWPRVRASLTVEAAFVVPFTLMIIFALMYMTFYMHDYCVVKSISDVAVSDVVHTTHSGSCLSDVVKQDENWFEQHLVIVPMHLSNNAKTQVKETIVASIRQKLFLFEYKESKIDMFLQKVTISVTLEASVPFLILRTLLPPLKLTVESSGHVHNPAMTVRLGKCLYEEFEKTKVFTKIDDFLKQ